MTTTAAQMNETRAAILEMAVTIEAPTDQVWETLIQSPDDWWIADMRCVPGDTTVTFEPRAGGHLMEANQEGGSLLWFTVAAIEPGVSVNLVGHVAPPFGGPHVSCLFLRLEDRDGKTVLHITNSMHGIVDESSLGQVEAGWRLLFEQGLKAQAESRTR